MLAQTFVDFELLVIDDGSRDDTAEVVAARDDSRLRMVRTENGGVAAARNRGLDLVTGSYVAFLDADDAWRPAKLERQHLAMKERPGVGMCFTSADVVNDNLQPIGVLSAVARPDYTQALVLEGNVIAAGASSVMARAPVVQQAGGFDPRLSQCADWDMWLRMSVIADFVAIDERLVLYRSVAGTMSSDPRLLERDTIHLFEKFYANPASAGYRAIRNRAYANQRMVFAGSYLHAHRFQDSLRCLIAAVRRDPRSAARLPSVPLRWADRARRRLLGRPRSNRDAISRRT